MSSALARRMARGQPQNPPGMPSLAGRIGLDSGVHRLLETPLSINGAEGSTILRFPGSQASAAGWPEYGGAGSWTWTGSPSFSQPMPHLGSLDGAVITTGAEYCVAPSAWWNLGTQDWVLELLVRLDAPTATKALLSTYVAPDADYWDLYTQAGGLKLAVDGAGGVATPIASTPTAGAWHLYHCFYDSSGSCIWYRDGGNAGAATVVSAIGALTLTRAPGLFARPDGAIPLAGAVGFLALHSRASGWLDTHLQPTLAAQRFALLTASRPAFSVVPSTYPSSAGSTSPVYQQRRLGDGTDRLFYMGAGSPTFDRIVDAAGRAVVGYLVEVGATNGTAQNRTYGSWSKEGVPTITANADAGPDGSSQAGKIEGITATGGVTIYEASISGLGADGTAIAPSLWIKRISTSGVLNVLSANGAATGRFTCDLAGLPDAWVRLHWDSPYVTKVTAHVTWGATGRSGLWLARSSGASPLSFFVDLAQTEAGDYMSSEIPTVASSVTRAASRCQYSLTNCFPRAEGTLLFALLARSFTPTRNRVLMSLSDGTTANELQVYTDTNGLVNASSRKAAGVSGDCQIAGSIMDNAIRRGMLSWRQGQLDLWLRSAAGVWTRSQDLTVDAIAGATLTTLSVGSDGAGAQQSGPGLWPLAGWQTIPEFVEDPSAARSGLDSLWGSM